MENPQKDAHICHLLMSQATWAAVGGIEEIQQSSEHVPTRTRTYWAMTRRVSIGQSRLPTGGGSSMDPAVGRD